MKKKIEQIQAKQERLLELLDLYRKAVENEDKLYHLFEDDIVNNKDNWTDTFLCECGNRGRRYLYHIPDHKYYLVNRITKEVVCYGNKQRLKHYMRLRNITESNVMIDANDFGGF